MDNRAIRLFPPLEFSNLAAFTFPQFITAAITLLIVVAAVFFIFSLIIGGIRWILSGGDKVRSETARLQITNALIGIFIVFAAWAITRFVAGFFGVDIFNIYVPTVQDVQNSYYY